MRVTARMPVLLSVLAAIQLSTPAQAGPLGGLEAVTSTIFQHNQSSFSGVGLRLKIQPPQLMDGLAIVPALEYWRNRSHVPSFGIDATRKDATLATFLRYEFSRQGWQPYLGAGLAVHFMSAEVNAPVLGLYDESDTLIKGGVLLVGGLTFGLAGNLGNLLEAEYHHVPDQSQFKFNWGLTWRFDTPAVK